MAQAAVNPPADTADPISNAVIYPEASLFVRQILQAALSSSAGASAGWAPEAQALLANVMMNDYLNWWNQLLPVDVNDAQKYVTAAITSPNPPQSVLALAYHAQGLIYRSQRTPQRQQAAFDAFTKALSCDGGLARAHAQLGNQKVLLGQEKNSHGDFQDARNLAPHHPACGYFYWGEGRAYFQEADWSNAIKWLHKSVDALPTVWYNRCYLAAAQKNSPDAATQAAADGTINDFLSDSRFDNATYRRIVPSLQPNSNDPQPVAAARAKVLAFVKPYLP